MREEGYLYPRFGEDRQRDVYSWLPFLLRVGSAHRRPQVLGEMGSHVQCICKFASLTVRRTLSLRCDFSSSVRTREGVPSWPTTVCVLLMSPIGQDCRQCIS